MNSKEFVKSKFPNARITKVTSGKIKGLQKVTYIVRDGKEYLGEGETETQAWNDAKDVIDMLD